MHPLLSSAQEALRDRRSAIGGAAARLTETLRRELEEIDAALARIEQGNYGYCERCGNAIGRLRLKAMPVLRRCLHCE